MFSDRGPCRTLADWFKGGALCDFTSCIIGDIDVLAGTGSPCGLCAEVPALMPLESDTSRKQWEAFTGYRAFFFFHKGKGPSRIWGLFCQDPAQAPGLDLQPPSLSLTLLLCFLDPLRLHAVLGGRLCQGPHLVSLVTVRNCDDSLAFRRNSTDTFCSLRGQSCMLRPRHGHPAKPHAPPGEQQPWWEIWVLFVCFFLDSVCLVFILAVL